MRKPDFMAQFLVTFSSIALIFGGAVTARADTVNGSQSGVPTTSTTRAPSTASTDTPPSLSQVRVLTVGGSVAHGWNDPEYNGYLQRAFNTLSDQYGVTYAVYDKTIVGANAVQLQETLYKGQYATWLTAIHPGIVVISWGLLNDCLPKTPMAQFEKDVGQEIQQAVDAHALVFVVTPPITKASYTQYKVQEQAYVDAQIGLVKRFGNQNVYLFDVYDQMKQYLAANQESYTPLSADGWHPNSAGHALAAAFLVQDIDTAFHLSAPALPNPPASTWSSEW